MSRQRPQALDNLVFGLAGLLFCVLAYYAFRQVQERRAAEQAAAASAGPQDSMIAASVAASAPSGLPPLGMTQSREAVSAEPAVASGAALPRRRR